MNESNAPTGDVQINFHCFRKEGDERGKFSAKSDENIERKVNNLR